MSASSTAKFNQIVAEKAIQIVFGVIATLSFAVGGWFFSRLQDSVDSLQIAVSELRTEISVMKVERQAIDKLEERLLYHEKLHAHQGAAIVLQSLEKRVTVLEAQRR